MQKFDADVIVAGGGIAGKTAAIAFAHYGFDVICVDPAKAAPDTRTTAYLQPAADFLSEIGIWQRVEAERSALQIMRILDASTQPAVVKDFDASDISSRPFGWNIGNGHMQAALDEAMKDRPNLQHLKAQSVEDIEARSTAAIARLSGGKKLSCKLLVAADGRASTVRQLMGISVSKTDYAQKAITFSVAHDQPHQNISTEVHEGGGPFTLVPLPDQGGRPTSAVVWMDLNARADALLQMDDAAFEQAVNKRSAGVLGPLSVTTKPSAWPIISQIAERFYGPRCALIAEAAHVLPPIGAQGLNLSLGDIRALAQKAYENKHDPGDIAVLKPYHQSRWWAAKARVSGIGMLNAASIAEHPFLNSMRSSGLRVMHDIPLIRKSMMRLGLGAG